MIFFQKIRPSLGWIALAIYYLEGGVWAPHVVDKAGLLFWGMDFVRFMLIPIFLLAAAARFNTEWLRVALRDMDKLSLGDIGKWILGVLFCCAGFWIMSWMFGIFAGSILNHWFGVPVRPDMFHKLMQSQQPELRTIAGLYLAFSAGLIEELYYRGLADRLAQACKRDDVNSLVYYAIGIGLFATWHWASGAYSMGGAIGIGLVASIYYRKTGSLSTVIAAHFLFDAIVI